MPIGLSVLVIDVTRLVERRIVGRLPTGVDRVSLEYVAHFGHKSRALVRLLGVWITPNLEMSQSLFKLLLMRDRSRGHFLWWLVRSVASVGTSLPNDHVLLNTDHAGLCGLGYSKRVRRKQLRVMFFLHDLIPLTHPEYFTPGGAVKHHERLRTMLSTGHGIVTNSKFTRDTLVDYATKIKAPVPPCRVAWLAPARLPSPGAQRPLSAPYFVVLGTIEPRKNHLMLLHVWRQMVDEFGVNTPRLVIIGHRGWECEQVVDLLERCDALHPYVVEKNRCSDEDLATWMGHAQALLFPSFVEGFGMPLVEALSLGLPVIASDLPVFREIAGEVPDYLDPMDGLGWKRSLVHYATVPSAARLAQCERIKFYKPPSWTEHFVVVEDLIGEALRSCGG